MLIARHGVQQYADAWNHAALVKAPELFGVPLMSGWTEGADHQEVRGVQRAGGAGYREWRMCGSRARSSKIVERETGRMISLDFVAGRL